MIYQDTYSSVKRRKFTLTIMDIVEYLKKDNKVPTGLVFDSSYTYNEDNPTEISIEIVFKREEDIKPDPKLVPLDETISDK